MCLETAQILSTIHHMKKPIGVEKNTNLYRPTHKNHPSIRWAALNQLTYDWTFSLFQALLAEYKFRYNRTHASASLSEDLKNPPTAIQRPVAKFSTPPCAIQEAFLRTHTNAPYKPTGAFQPREVSSLHSYRNYYANGKSHLLRYTKRPLPSWVEEYLH